jgi:hypothetical protein
MHNGSGLKVTGRIGTLYVGAKQLRVKHGELADLASLLSTYVVYVPPTYMP